MTHSKRAREKARAASIFCLENGKCPFCRTNAAQRRLDRVWKPVGKQFNTGGGESKEGIAQNAIPSQAVEKVEHSWAFSHLYGKISMGDERCLNEGSWIVES